MQTPTTDRGSAANGEPFADDGRANAASSSVHRAGDMPMTDAIRRRRLRLATTVLAAILTVFPATQGAALIADGATAEGSGSTTGTDNEPNKVCQIDWRKGNWYVKKLIRCAARHHGISTDKALSIAHRESRFDPEAFNHSSCAKGLFQHLCKYWPDRADAFGFDGWSAFNARANAMVTMKMVKRYGWTPWGG